MQKKNWSCQQVLKWRLGDIEDKWRPSKKVAHESPIWCGLKRSNKTYADWTHPGSRVGQDWWPSSQIAWVLNRSTNVAQEKQPAPVLPRELPAKLQQVRLDHWDWDVKFARSMPIAGTSNPASFSSWFLFQFQGQFLDPWIPLNSLKSASHCRIVVPNRPAATVQMTFSRKWILSRSCPKVLQLGKPGFGKLIGRCLSN